MSRLIQSNERRPNLEITIPTSREMRQALNTFQRV